MKTLRNLFLMTVVMTASLTVYGGKTYGSIGITADGSYAPLPANTVIKVTGNDISIQYKLSKNGWYDVNIPARGKFKVTCVWKGQEFQGILISASGPQRYNVHLRKKGVMP